MRDPYEISRTPSAIKNVGRCVAWGLGLGIALSLFVSVRHVLVGPETIHALDATLGKVVFSYLAGGVLAGGIVGVLLPLARWLWGAAIVGTFAGSVVYGLVGYLDDGGIHLDMALVLGVVVGAPVGVIYRSIFRS